jgi:hypothetical protein
MKVLVNGFIKLVKLPFTVFVSIFSLFSKQITFIKQILKEEKEYKNNKKKFIRQKKKSIKLNDEIV